MRVSGHKGVIEWNGWASCSVVPALGAILLHDLPSQQLRASLFVNAIHLFTGETSLTPSFFFATFLSTFAVIFNGSLHTNLSWWMSDSQFVICLSIVVLVSLALCRLQDAYPSQIYSVLQEHESAATAFASGTALLLALVCYVNERAVDTLLLPGYGAEILKDQPKAVHQAREEVIRSYGVCLFMACLIYQLSYGMYYFTVMSGLLVMWLISRQWAHSELLRLYNLWLFCGTPFFMFLVALELIQGRGWANCFVIPTLGAILHDQPSHQLRASLFLIALLLLKGDSAQVLGSVVLGLVSTILSIRATTKLLQQDFYDKLEQAKLKEVV